MTAMHKIRPNLIGIGGERPVGVEIEFERVDAFGVASAVHRRFGGTIRIDGPHRISVRGTEFGNFRIEPDWRWVRPCAGTDGRPDAADRILGVFGRDPVPTEVATPPIPAARLCEIDVLVHDLARPGHEGTSPGRLDGIGLHLNPSLGPADLTPGSILRVMQAYLLQAPDRPAAANADTDTLGSPLPVGDRFPADYVDRVLDPA